MKVAFKSLSPAAVVKRVCRRVTWIKFRRFLSWGQRVGRNFKVAVKEFPRQCLLRKKAMNGGRNLTIER